MKISLLLTLLPKKINPFYGMIGPNLYSQNVKSLFQLITGEGVIQGVFLNNNKLVRHIIQTEPRPSLLFYPSYLAGHIKQNPMGVANTALMPIESPDENTTAVYALFERDVPYLVHIYHNTSTIKTIGRMNGPHLSGHTKNNESINYHIFQKRIDFFNLPCENKISIPTHYLPIVHDFLSTPTKIIITDSPIVLDPIRLLKGKLPIYLNSKLPTYIHVIDKKTKQTITHKYNKGFYLFHYGHIKNNTITASIYDEIDFDDIYIHGKLCTIQLQLGQTNPKIKKIDEKYNLDFPVEDYKKRLIFRNIHNKRINGYVRIDNNKVDKTWFFDEYFFCGECVIQGNILFSLANTLNHKGVFIKINMDTDEINIIHLDKELTMGFHSIMTNYTDQKEK